MCCYFDFVVLMFDRLWTQRLNKVRRVIVENLGIRRISDLAAWSVAGGIAYWLWVRPTLKERAENQAARELARAKAAQRAAELRRDSTP